MSQLFVFLHSQTFWLLPGSQENITGFQCDLRLLDPAVLHVLALNCHYFTPSLSAYMLVCVLKYLSFMDIFVSFENKYIFLFLSLSSSCLQGARMAGRDSRRSNRTDTRKLFGVFIVQDWKNIQTQHLLIKLEWRGLDLTAQNLTIVDKDNCLSRVEWELKLDQAEPYQMDLIQKRSEADWRENHKLHWKKKDESHCSSGC